MKISGISTYFPVLNTMYLNDISPTVPSCDIDNLSPNELDTYHASKIETKTDDLYTHILKYQQEMVPYLNIFYLVLQGSVRVFNGPINTINRTWRYVERMGGGSFLNEKKRFTSAFILGIENEAEE